MQTKSIIGPFSYDQAMSIIFPAPTLTIVQLFAIQQSNKIRPITDFSYPKTGISINSELDPAFKTVEYPNFRSVVRIIHDLGRYALIWVLDAKDAYLRVPAAGITLDEQIFHNVLLAIWTGIQLPTLYSLHRSNILDSEELKSHTIHQSPQTIQNIWATLCG